MVYCDRCDRWFPNERALDQHEQDSSSHNICNSCGVDYAMWFDLKEHYFCCQRCDERFCDNKNLLLHYHNDHSYCGICSKLFRNDLGLHEHNRQCHHYCVDCKRVFRAASNLNSHLNSSIHRPKDVRCPFKGCTLTFVSRSAMILHLESGGCHSGVNRRIINQYVREYDRTNIITNPARLLTGGSSDKVTYYASSAAWNGSSYKCYLCHSGFRTLPRLNQHLASPHHQDKIYFCPLSTCRVEFSTLSALCQHIESEKCGVGRFQHVQTAMDNLVGRVGRLTM